MLFKEIHIQGIKSGTISLAFRKWEKASVKRGSIVKTAIGLIEIVGITTINEDKITSNDVLRAGFQNKEQLLKSLRQNNKGSIYKIAVRYYAEDPRIELREQTILSNKEYLELKEKLARLDKHSRQGHWTGSVLLTIRDNPHRKAIEISKLTNLEKEWLKLNIRKLKNLGLTISHHVGYELSPLGKTFIEKLLSEK